MHSMHINNFFNHLQNNPRNTNTVTITPNRRLSANLHKRYQQFQLEQKLQTWETPTLLPYNTWVTLLYNELLFTQHNTPPLLLTPSQEQLLWEKVIEKNKEQHSQLLQLSETAELLKSAWSLLNQWQIDVNQPAFSVYEDGIILKSWIDEFKNLCEQYQCIDSSSIVEFVIQNIKNKSISIPQHIFLFGFTEHTPQLIELLNVCEMNEAHIQTLELTLTHKNHKNINHNRIQARDEEDEALTMARWAKATLATHPHACIGCVFPFLEKKRDRIAQIFSSVFADTNTYTIVPEKAVFNISAGKNLARYPIIHAALTLLNLTKKTISSETLSYLLTTPFIGQAETEKLKRAHFDAECRLKNYGQFNFLDLIKNDNNKNHDLSLQKNCPLLAKRLQQFLAILADNQSHHFSYRKWAILFNQLLTAIGWPGERSLISEEYQVVEAWLNLLSEFQQLEQISQPVDLFQALQTLQKMANNMPFQAKTPQTSIQILGILEAAGMPFDFLWVSGLDDINWPPQPKPHPFIPKKVQREHHMPHASAHRELTFCQLITQQFQQCTPHLIFSHAEKKEDMELQASALIKDIPPINKEHLTLSDYILPAYKIFQTKKLEVLHDEKATPVNTNEKLRGGINILKQQALCPFKSFAKCRLHARELKTPLPGLKATDRGVLIHKVLELIWNQLKNQTTLSALNEKDLHALINHSIDTAFIGLPNSHCDSTHYLSLEKQRTHELVYEWLSIEKNRSLFKVIVHEQTYPLTIGPLTLTLRIDRIDELEDGRKLIIDYKTGKNITLNNWFGDKPEEPQLPLYALFNNENRGGIAFAHIYPGEYSFKGMSDAPLAIDGIKKMTEFKKTNALSWQEQLQQWQAIFLQLSQDFYTGCAIVSPKDHHQTCSFCSLKSFCRINEDVQPFN